MTSEPNTQQPSTMLNILPADLVLSIMTLAPQLGNTCKALYTHLPKVKNPYLRFPSVDTNPRDLVEVRHNGLLFLYEQFTASSMWNGISPEPHGASGRVVYICDFCRKTDVKTTMVGSHHMGGVLFVCPKCKRGLEIRLNGIVGETLWTLINTNQRVMVPRKNGPPELWYFSSMLPVLHHGVS